MLVDSLVYVHFSLFLCCFFFILFVTEKTQKHVKTLKKMISTSERCVKHLFAAQNTQPLALIAIPWPTVLGLQTGRHGEANRRV